MLNKSYSFLLKQIKITIFILNYYWKTLNKKKLNTNFQKLTSLIGHCPQPINNDHEFALQSNGFFHSARTEPCESRVWLKFSLFNRENQHETFFFSPYIWNIYYVEKIGTGPCRIQLYPWKFLWLKYS